MGRSRSTAFLRCYAVSTRVRRRLSQALHPTHSHLRPHLPAPRISRVPGRSFAASLFVSLLSLSTAAPDNSSWHQRRNSSSSRTVTNLAHNAGLYTRGRCLCRRFLFILNNFWRRPHSALELLHSWSSTNQGMAKKYIRGKEVLPCSASPRMSCPMAPRHEEQIPESAVTPRAAPQAMRPSLRPWVQQPLDTQWNLHAQPAPIAVPGLA
eukprot:43060-Rhodomonas_salina.1